MSADQLQPGEVIACRYRVEAHCRNHPLGELYRCVDDTAGHTVLLQRLRREFCGTEVRDRLFETRESASLESKVIADILDYGEDLDGRPFLVTAWSEHASLDAVERPLSFAEAVAIVERVASALAPLHARRLVHGNIEPASVLVDDERELTNLHGFGLAPALEAGAQRTRALPLLVSPGFAAPELIRGVPIGPAADVYALGVMLWELIFAELPFRGPTLKVLDAHLNKPLPGFELPFDAPASFEWVLRRMLAKSPADRFSDAGEVAQQLRAYRDVTVAPVLQLVPAPACNDASGSSIRANDDDDDETVVFEAVRDSSAALPRTVARGSETQLVEPAPASAPDVDVAIMPSLAHASAPRSSSARRWAPRLAAALLAVASLWLWVSAMQPAETELAAEAVAPEIDGHQALANRVEPVAVEAFSRTPVLAVQPPARPTPVVRPPALERLGAAAFRDHKAELYRRVEQRCTDGNIRRSLKLAVRVGADGRVEAATVIGKIGASKLGRCVERQARQLAFPPSREGGFHHYTLRLR